MYQCKTKPDLKDFSQGQDQDWRMIKIILVNENKEHTFPIVENANLAKVREEIESTCHIKFFDFIWKGNVIRNETIPFDRIVMNGEIRIRSKPEQKITEQIPKQINSILQAQRRKFEKKLDKISAQITCPIAQIIPSDPVVIADGFTYDRQSIQNSFQMSKKSPMTNQQLQNYVIHPNRAVKNIMPLIENISNDLEGYTKDISKHFMQRETELKWLVEMMKGKLKNLAESINSERKKIFDGLQKIRQKVDQIKQNETTNQKATKKVYKQNSKLKTEIYAQIQTMIAQKQVQKDSIAQLQKQLDIDPSDSLNIKLKSIYSLDGFEYLLRKFDTQEKVIKMLKVSYDMNSPFTQFFSLNHDKVEFQANEFLKYDWKKLRVLSLNDTRAKNNDLSQLAVKSQQLENLQSLHLNNNMIRDITLKDIKAFKNLIYVDLRNNPLTLKSIKNLQMLQKDYSQVQVDYDQKEANVKIVEKEPILQNEQAIKYLEQFKDWLDNGDQIQVLIKPEQSNSNLEAKPCEPLFKASTALSSMLSPQSKTDQFQNSLKQSKPMRENNDEVLLKIQFEKNAQKKNHTAQILSHGLSRRSIKLSESNESESDDDLDSDQEKIQKITVECDQRDISMKKRILSDWEDEIKDPKIDYSETIGIFRGLQANQNSASYGGEIESYEEYDYSQVEMQMNFDQAQEQQQKEQTQQVNHALSHSQCKPIIPEYHQVGINPNSSIITTHSQQQEENKKQKI